MTIEVLGAQLEGWAALNLAIQFILPLLVGLATTKVTSRGAQFLLLSGLTLLATVGAQALQAHDAGLPLNLVQIIVVAAVNFLVSTLSHYGVWKPTNLTELVLATLRTAPTPDDPAPQPPAAALPSRHLYTAPTFREGQKAGGDHVLQPVQKDTA